MPNTGMKPSAQRTRRSLRRGHSATDKMNNLNLVAIFHSGRRPVVSAHDGLINLDRDSLRHQRQFAN